MVNMLQSDVESTNCETSQGEVQPLRRRPVKARAVQVELFDAPDVTTSPTSGHSGIGTHFVSELPSNPIDGAEYSFRQLTRKDVVRNNHSLHKYPAKFIPQIPQWALDYGAPKPHETILDPFCGSGTTLVEAGVRGCYAIGTDVSPLAVVITRAKTAQIKLTESKVHLAIDAVCIHADRLAPSIERDLVSDPESHSLHKTWSFWFRPREMALLLALRKAITDEYRTDGELEQFLLACLSSIAKSCSFLNEDQIKVRFDKTKKVAHPITAFRTFARDSLLKQLALGKAYRSAGARFLVEKRCAMSLCLASSSVDRIITSPPYINAIDYTMAHKYNLFILGLLEPSLFKSHCREYIGVTERAVRSQDLKTIPVVGDVGVDSVVRSLWAQDTPTSRNRAFVVAQYFRGMRSAFEEFLRVLRRHGHFFFVVGETNRICGLTVETASLLSSIAQQIGFTVDRYFYHCLANRSSMRLNRSITGGTVAREAVYIFRKNSA